MSGRDVLATGSAAVSSAGLAGRIDALSRQLLQRAARRGPPPLGERLEEEWLADFAARPGATSRLRLALGCCWAAGVIAHEHAVAQRKELLRVQCSAGW
jgi:hypothetical protein